MVEEQSKIQPIMSPTIGKLTTALVKAQGEIKPIGKAGEVDYVHNGKQTQYRYALYTDMWQMGHEALRKNGLDFSLHPMGNIVMGLMKHESGEYLGGWLDITLTPNKYNKYDPTDVGEWVTYLSKYLYKAALNLPTDDNELMSVAKNMASLEKAEDKKAADDEDTKMYEGLSKAKGVDMTIDEVKDFLASKGFDSAQKVRAKTRDPILELLRAKKESK